MPTTSPFAPSFRTGGTRLPAASSFHRMIGRRRDRDAPSSQHRLAFIDITVPLTIHIGPVASRVVEKTRSSSAVHVLPSIPSGGEEHCRRLLRVCHQSASDVERCCGTATSASAIRARCAVNAGASQGSRAMGRGARCVDLTTSCTRPSGQGRKRYFAPPAITSGLACRRRTTTPRPV